MKTALLPHPLHSKRGIALIAVISIVAIMTILTVAMLSLSQNERRAATKYADGEMAKNLADSAVNIVIGQISEATFRDNSEWGTWSSQPGAIRTYRANGGFKAGYKLYSDDQLITAATGGNGVADEKAFSLDAPDADWQENPAVWADLNEPVIKPDRDGDGEPEVVFPIVDPRAFIRTQYSFQTGESTPDSTNVEGFSYQNTFAGVIDATSVTDINARLPMPVRWLYVLKDGSLGYMDSGGGNGSYKYMPADGSNSPTVANPIVGRVAFWTDDETSKININTASEPTYWSTPFAYHDREYQWAVSQPARFEYQRYPGHPATIALSTVLFPNKDMEIRGKIGTQRDNILKMKERIYQIIPKMNRGGSQSGTVPFWSSSDPKYSGTKMTRVEVHKAVNQPLYASVDELLFSTQVNGGRRLTHDEISGAYPIFTDPTNPSSVNEERALERTRFFLTTHSRSPELNVFGQPRVAMWPVSNEARGGNITGDPTTYRTVFDNLIAYCASLGGTADATNSYVFRRASNSSPTYDFSNILRNRELLNYLYEVMSRPFPQGGSGSASFATKWNGAEVAQVLTLIFDYIRSTNLYDGVLSPARSELLSRSGDYWMTGSVAQRLTKRDTLRSSKTRTFTSDRGSGEVAFSFTGSSGSSQTTREDISYSAYPGHGQVVPIKTTISGNQSQGLGRFPTLSEIGFHFIATADGTPDEGSWPVYAADGSVDTNFPATGGRTSTKLRETYVDELSGAGSAEVEMMVHPVTGESVPDRWYSNFAPFPASHDRYRASNDPMSKNYWQHHPGFRARNWNTSLVRNTPLPTGVRRIQGMISMELTTVAAGYTGIFPDMTIVVTGAKDMTVRSKPNDVFPEISNRLFPNSDSTRLYWRAPASLFQTTHNRENGSSVGPGAMSQSRHIAGRGNTPADPSYQPEYSNANTTYEGAANLEFVTQFFNAAVSGGNMTFSGGGITVEIYAGRSATAANLVQTINVNFPQVTMPIPELVVIGTAGTQWRNAGDARIYNAERVEAPRWWSFNYGGVIGRYGGLYNPLDPIQVSQGPPIITPSDTTTGAMQVAEGLTRGRTLGRLFQKGNQYGKRFGTPRMDHIVWASTGSGTRYIGDNPAGKSVMNTYGDYMKPNQPNTMSTSASASGSTLGLLAPDVSGPFGQDVMISMVPAHGDIRLLAAKAVVPTSDWVLHPASSATTYMAHSFARFSTDYEEGYNVGSNNNFRYVNSGRYQSASRPDYPPTPRVQSLREAQRSGDWDTGSGSMRDGPWINKPDEGNTGIEDKSSTAAGNTNNLVRTPTAYYDEMWRSSEAGEAFISPNRMIPSPGVLGSLPTGIKRDKAFETILFRPWVPTAANAPYKHPGSPNYQGSASNTNTGQTPYAGQNPADHYIMDLFWMPVVEPYAISEAFSTAGKVNLNYQIMPFHSYIRRATGMHAVLKDELILAYPNSNIAELHTNPGSSQFVTFNNGYGNYHYRAKWSELASNSTTAYYSGTGGQPAPQRFWHRKINLDRRASASPNFPSTSTLGHMEARFNFTASLLPAAVSGLFRTASQIAETHLVPHKIGGALAASVETADTRYTDGSDSAPTTPYTFVAMASFWQPRSATGENLREKPYTNIYGKVTTQSNTYRVHYRAQVIRKARSAAVDEFSPTVDSVTSDYRGSSVIERRIDPADPRLPNYGKTPSAQPLDRYYNYRILEARRFTP